jgi:hypothetical protein
VQIEPLGGGNFYYHLTLGAWNWNIIDFLMKIPTLAAFADDNANVSTEYVVIAAVQSGVAAHATWSTQARVMGNYVLRTSPVGDGRDGYTGLCTAGP